MRIFNIIYRTADNTVAEANIAATNKSKATSVVEPNTMSRGVSESRNPALIFIRIYLYTP